MWHGKRPGKLTAISRETRGPVKIRRRSVRTIHYVVGRFGTVACIIDSKRSSTSVRSREVPGLVLYKARIAGRGNTDQNNKTVLPPLLSKDSCRQGRKNVSTPKTRVFSTALCFHQARTASQTAHVMTLPSADVAHHRPRTPVACFPSGRSVRRQPCLPLATRTPFTSY